MSEELNRFLEHVDSILELTKPVYAAGERTDDLWEEVFND